MSTRGDGRREGERGRKGGEEVRLTAQAKVVGRAQAKALGRGRLGLEGSVVVEVVHGGDFVFVFVLFWCCF